MSSSTLDDAAVSQALQELPGWQRTGNVLFKTFIHDDFGSAIRFVDRVADAAEAANRGGQAAGAARPGAPAHPPDRDPPLTHLSAQLVALS